MIARSQVGRTRHESPRTIFGAAALGRSEPLPRSGMGKIDKRALAASLDLDG